MFYKNYCQVSLIQFFMTFKENVAKIYQALLQRQKVIFVGYERSIQQTIQYTCCCYFLVQPFNIIP